MKNLEDLLHKFVIKKNYGFMIHRYYVQENSSNEMEPGLDKYRKKLEQIKGLSTAPKERTRENRNEIKSLEMTADDVAIAASVVKLVDIQNKEDMFLGLSCVVLLSAYAKYKENVAKHTGNKLAENIFTDNLYYYKSCANEIIIEALKKDLDFSFCVKPDGSKGNVTIIEIAGTQFAFHNGVTSETLKYVQEHGIKQYKEDLTWKDEAHFQNAAKNLFTFALHLKNTSNLRIINEKPIDYAKSEYARLQTDKSPV